MQLDYHLTADEWAKACFYYSESSGMMRFAVKCTTMTAVLFVPLFILFAFGNEINIIDASFGISILFWLFARKKINLKFMKYRLKKKGFVDNPVSLSLSENGIVWSFKGFPDAKKTWDSVKMIIEIKNGFIIPDKEFRFIFVPERCFDEQKLAQFQDLILKHKIKVKYFRKWEC